MIRPILLTLLATGCAVTPTDDPALLATTNQGPPPAGPIWAHWKLETSNFQGKVVELQPGVLAFGWSGPEMPARGPVGLILRGADGRLTIEEAPIDLSTRDFRPEVGVGDVDGDGERELVVLSSEGLTIVDPLTWQVQAQHALWGAEGFLGPLGRVNRPALEVADLDRDGVDQILFSHDGVTYEISPSGELRHRAPLSGRLVAGQLDGDAALEIAGSSGVIDGITWSPQPAAWFRRQEGQPAALIDTTGDGLADPLWLGRTLHQRDGATGALRWSYLNADPATYRAPLLLDLGRDGSLDLLHLHPRSIRPFVGIEVASGSGRHLLRPPFGQAVPTVAASTDLDGDGHAELVLADGGYLVAFDTGTLTWQHHRHALPASDAVPHDVDGDGDEDAMYAVEVGHLDRRGGFVVAVDPHTGAELLALPWERPAGRTGGYIEERDAVQLDADPELEILLIEQPQGPLLLDLDGGVVTVSELPAFDALAQQVVAADVDGDGRHELAYTDGFRVCVRDAQSSTPRWCQTGHLARTIGVVDLDGDGRDEVLDLSEAQTAVVYDGANGAELLTFGTTGPRATLRSAGGTGVVAAESRGDGVDLVVYRLAAGVMSEVRRFPLDTAEVRDLHASGDQVWVTPVQGNGWHDASHAWSLTTGAKVAGPVHLFSATEMAQIDGTWIGGNIKGTFAYAP